MFIVGPVYKTHGTLKSFSYPEGTHVTVSLIPPTFFLLDLVPLLEPGSQDRPIIHNLDLWQETFIFYLSAHLAGPKFRGEFTVPKIPPAPSTFPLLKPP